MSVHNNYYHPVKKKSYHMAGCMTCNDTLVLFPAMAEQYVGFGSDPTDGPLLPTQHPVTAAAAVASWPEVDAAAAECVEERSCRRRIANRESARRYRARKLRHLDELRDSAALLERENRDLAVRAEAEHARLSLALLANAALRAEAAGLSRRLTAARQSSSAVCTTPGPMLLSASTTTSATAAWSGPRTWRR
jgi:hypothetical protein